MKISYSQTVAEIHAHLANIQHTLGHQAKVAPAPTLTREEVWLRAWAAVAGSHDCKKSDVATNWANTCLKEFDARFGDAK